MCDVTRPCEPGPARLQPDVGVHGERDQAHAGHRLHQGHGCERKGGDHQQRAAKVRGQPGQPSLAAEVLAQDVGVQAEARQRARRLFLQRGIKLRSLRA